MVTGEGEEEKVSGDEDVNFNSFGDEKDASEGEDQSLLGDEKDDYDNESMFVDGEKV